MSEKAVTISRFKFEMIDNKNIVLIAWISCLLINKYPYRVEKKLKLLLSTELV